MFLSYHHNIEYAVIDLQRLDAKKMEYNARQKHFLTRSDICQKLIFLVILFHLFCRSNSVKYLGIKTFSSCSHVNDNTHEPKHSEFLTALYFLQTDQFSRLTPLKRGASLPSRQAAGSYWNCFKTERFDVYYFFTCNLRSPEKTTTDHAFRRKKKKNHIQMKFIQ